MSGNQSPSPDTGEAPNASDYEWQVDCATAQGQFALSGQLSDTLKLVTAATCVPHLSPEGNTYTYYLYLSATGTSDDNNDYLYLVIPQTGTTTFPNADAAITLSLDKDTYHWGYLSPPDGLPLVSQGTSPGEPAVSGSVTIDGPTDPTGEGSKDPQPDDPAQPVRVLLANPLRQRHRPWRRSQAAGTAGRPDPTATRPPELVRQRWQPAARSVRVASLRYGARSRPVDS